MSAADECFTDGDSSDESFEVVALSSRPSPRRRRPRSPPLDAFRDEPSSSTSVLSAPALSPQLSTSSISPTSVQYASSTRSLVGRTSQPDRLLARSSSTTSYTADSPLSSSRLISGLGSKRIGRSAAARNLSTIARSIALLDGGAHQVVHLTTSIRELLASEAIDIDDLLSSGALASLIEKAPQFVSSPGCTEHSCRLIADACAQSPKARQIVQEAAAVKYFVQAIQTHLHTYASVTEAAINAIGSSCSGKQSPNLDIVRTCGGVENVLAAMRRWKENRALQSASLRAIELTSEGSPRNQSEISVYGGIQEVISTMMYFAEDSRIQAYAISTIIALCSSNSEIQDELGGSGAVSAVTAAINQFSSRLDITSYGALALGYLCSHGPNRDRLSDSRSIDAILAALDQISRKEQSISTEAHKDGVAHCLLSLIACVKGHDENKRAASSHKHLHIIVRGARQYLSDARVADRASRLLCILLPLVLESNRRGRTKNGSNPMLFLPLGNREPPGEEAAISLCIDLTICHVARASLFTSSAEAVGIAIRASKGRSVVSNPSFRELQEAVQRAVEIHTSNGDVVAQAIELYDSLRHEATKQPSRTKS